MQVSAPIKFIAIILFFTSPLIFADKHQEQHVSHNAHVHGLSELTLAMEGEKLEIQLKSPAMNLLGFEHKARTKNDIAAVENTQSLLSNPGSLFLFSEEHCSVTDTTIDVSAVLDSEHDRHGDDEDKTETDDHEHEDRHSEIIASYHYRCESTATLSSITVNLFEKFAGIQQIRTLWITEKQQGGLTLNAENRIIILKR